MRHRLSMLLADLLLIAFATLCALVLRDNLELAPERLLGLLPYLGITLTVAAPVLVILGLNRAIWRMSVPSDYMHVIFAVIIIMLATVALGFLINRLNDIARSLPILQAILMALMLIGARGMARQRHAMRRREAPLRVGSAIGAQKQETVLVAGINTITELYLQAVKEFAADHIKIAGLLGRSRSHTGRLVRRQRVLGTLEEAEDILKALEVHGVFVDRIVCSVAFSRLSQKAQEVLLHIERQGTVKLDFFAERTYLESKDTGAISGPQVPCVSQARGVFSFETEAIGARARRPFWHLKRALDALVAACLTVALSPLILLVGVLVAIDLGPTIAFWQQRPGLGGRPFRLYKFRTMGSAYDSDGRRIPDEQRLSSLGRFLRRSRLDELPQLYNILVGDMSFVGPRPLLPGDQVSSHAARLLIRPGLTGWAQVKGGRDISASDKAALDIWYVRNASVSLDLQIMVWTVPMILFGDSVNRKAIRKAWQELREVGICPSGELSANTATTQPLPQ